MAKAKKTSLTLEAVEDAEKTEASEVFKAPLISFDEYIEKAKPHYGLVASFTYEASRTEKGLADRTEDEWILAFEEQSRRTYK